MRAKLNQREMATYRKYHIPGQGNLRTRKVDEYRLSRGNTWSHEITKFLIGMQIQRGNSVLINDRMKNFINELGELLELCFDVPGQKGGHFIMEAELNRKVDGDRKIRDVVQLDPPEPHEVETSKTRGERHEKGINVWRLY